MAQVWAISTEPTLVERSMQAVTGQSGWYEARLPSNTTRLKVRAKDRSGNEKESPAIVVPSPPPSL